MRPAGAQPPIDAVKVDHAIRQKRELLIDLARAGIDAGTEDVVRRQPVFNKQAGLLLRNGFAGIETGRGGNDLARILVELCMGQPQGVLRQRLIECVDDAGKCGVA